MPPEGKAKESLIFRIASAVKGAKLTSDEGKTWTLNDVNALAGKQIVLVVEVTTKQDGGEMNTITTFMHAREMLPDIDEASGGAEQPAAARYASVPPAFRPKTADDGPEITIGDMPA